MGQGGGPVSGKTFKNAQNVCVCVFVHICMFAFIHYWILSHLLCVIKVSEVECLMAQNGDRMIKAKQRGGARCGGGSVGVDLTLGRLRKLHVFLARHEPSQLQQHHLDAVGVLPLGQCSYSMHVNLQDTACKDGGHSTLQPCEAHKHTHTRTLCCMSKKQQQDNKNNKKHLDSDETHAVYRTYDTERNQSELPPLGVSVTADWCATK